MTEIHSKPETAIRPLRVDEVEALRKMADEGPSLLGCGCDSNPELCHCSTIMMLCDEWLELKSCGFPAQKTLSGSDAEVVAIIDDMACAWCMDEDHPSFRKDCENLIGAVQRAYAVPPQDAPAQSTLSREAWQDKVAFALCEELCDQINAGVDETRELAARAVASKRVKDAMAFPPQERAAPEASDAREAIARMLVPYWPGGFERQETNEHGHWEYPPYTPNARALEIADKALAIVAARRTQGLG